MSEDDSVKHEGKWTRADLPSGGKIRDADDMAGNGLRSRVIDIALDEVVEHLNTHHSKPEPDKWRAEWVAVSEDLKAARRQSDLAHEQWQKWEGRAVRAERERDAAIARAEQAEKRHQWPKTTPTGHTYIAPDTYAALRHQHGNAAQAAIESWEADECPPEPTWEMAGIAHREVERIRCERDEARKALEDERIVNESMTTSLFEVSRQRDDAVIGRDEWKARAEKAEADRENITEEFADFRVEVVAEAVKHRESHPHESGADPVVYAVRESDIAAVEAEQAVDPVEAKAIELHQVAYGGRIGFGHATLNAQEMFRSLARHVLGQEADQ